MRYLALVALATVLSLAGMAADWPHFLGPNGDGRAPDTGINKDWNARPPALLWKTALSDGGFAGPSVAAGMLFIVDHRDGKDVVRALDANTGKDLNQPHVQALEAAIFWEKLLDTYRRNRRDFR